MTDKENKAIYLAKELLSAGFTLAGAAGIIANIEAESAFKSTNLQDSYERSLGVDDAHYTALVDSGQYTRFATDSAGYGLVQWTAQDRKAGMYRFHKSRGKSIGDFATQVAWLIEEIKGYTRAYNTCRTSLSPYACGYEVCKFYEMPADTENQAQYRGNLAVRWHDWLKENMDSANTESGYTPPIKDPVSATFPPDPSILGVQLILWYNGYYAEEDIDGRYSDKFINAYFEFGEDMRKTWTGK